jgi:hypothetical protein
MKQICYQLDREKACQLEELVEMHSYERRAREEMQKRNGAGGQMMVQVTGEAAVCLFICRDPKIAGARCRCKQYDVAAA